MKLSPYLPSFCGMSLICAALVLPGEAMAYDFDECDGDPTRIEGQLRETENRFSMGSSGPIHDSYLRSIWAWDQLSQQFVLPYYYRPESDPTMVVGDNYSEIGRVLRSDIEGNNGMTE